MLCPNLERGQKAENKSPHFSTDCNSEDMDDYTKFQNKTDYRLYLENCCPAVIHNNQF